MPRNYSLFGIRSDNLEEIRARVEKHLGAPLHLRDGNDLGFYYRSPLEKNTNVIRINRNRYEDEDGVGLWKPQYGDFKIIISLVDSDKVEVHREILQNSSDLRAVLLESRDSTE